jgi:bacteriorhodopsin
MAVSTLAFIYASSRVHRTQRTFHYITAAITLVASIAYFTMASNLGYAAIIVEFMRSDPKVAGTYREVFYVRYIDWFVTTPVSISQTPIITAADRFHSFSFWICS